jgi:WD40 repeat protein
LSYGDRRWNVATGQYTLLPPTPTPAPGVPPSLARVTDVVWSDDGATLITASGLSIDVWDARTGSHQEHIDVAGIETEWRLYATPSIALSPDGRSLVAASIGMERGYGLEEGRAITLWDVESGSLIRMISEAAERVNDAAWSPDGHILAVASDTEFALWDTTTWQEVYQGTPACCVAWSPDGSYLAIGRGSRAEIRDPATGEVIQESGFYLGQSSNRVTALTWSPAGTDLAVAVGGATAIWNWQTNERPFVLEPQGLMIPSVAWSPDGTLLAVATGVTPIPWPVGFSGAFFEPGLWGDHNFVVWDMATGEPLQVLYGHAAEIEAVTWSPDGTLLASGSLDGSVLIWDIR